MKPSWWKDATYREAVLSLPCCRCGSPANGHHSRTRPDGQAYGLGQKAPDYEEIPLCPSCHQHGDDAFHDMDKARRRDLELEYVKQTQDVLIHLIPEEYFEWTRERYRLD